MYWEIKFFDLSCDFTWPLRKGLYDLVGEISPFLATTLSSLLVIVLVKHEIECFWFATRRHVTAWSRVIWLCGQELLTLRHNCAKFDGSRFYGSKDEIYLFCHTASRDHMIGSTCALVGGSQSPWVITPPNLMLIDHMEVEIKFVTWHNVWTWWRIL